MIIHIDCNSFYASCELSFRPDLQGKPVVVANCNEAGGGIILALSKEAKALGLKRGDPVFKVNDVLNKNNVAVFPANLPKYVDISRRLMQVVREQNIILDFKQYSVDEFFGELPLDDPEELREIATKVKNHIQQCTGIPVSCGMSLTYTLAKIATWYAKHYKGYDNICVLPQDKIEVALSKIAISDVWGIGRRSAPRLESKGITTALALYQKSEYDIKKLLNINGVRTWKELHGVQSITLDSQAKQKSIMHSRTFAFMATDYQTMKEYIAEYAVAAARKLRDQHAVCLCVSVFIHTNHHRDDLEQYDDFATTRLTMASSDTFVITKAALKALESIYMNGYHYKRAGVILSDIVTDDAIQLDLFQSSPETIAKSQSLMKTIDAITTKYGMDSIKLAVQGNKEGGMNLKNFQELKNETSNINDIIETK